MKEDLDCSGFNFHCPERRGYVIFDPQSQEESDRLDALLGATPLWRSVLEKRQSKLAAPEGEIRAIEAFTELLPVGWTSNDEVVAVVVAGAAGFIERKLNVSGQWFAVRFPVQAEAELKSDLQTELRQRNAKIEQAVAKLGGQR